MIGLKEELFKFLPYIYLIFSENDQQDEAESSHFVIFQVDISLGQKSEENWWSHFFIIPFPVSREGESVCPDTGCIKKGLILKA